MSGGGDVAAMLLDAADGKIDGKVFGQELGAMGATSVSSSVTVSGTGHDSEAARTILDGLDGKIDGKFYGQELNK
jgi:hypothetical protein